MEKMYNWEYIYRGDIYRMENGKGVLEEKDIDVAYMEDEHAWARINDILDCLYPFGLTDDKEKKCCNLRSCLCQTYVFANTH